MYKIYLDKQKNFECLIKVEGASLHESKVFLVLETESYELRFPGKIKSNGKVEIPVAKLKGILKENMSGKMYLEVIADDTYFTPYKSQYETDIQTKVEVEISDKETITENKAKKVIVEVSDQNFVDGFIKLLLEKGITIKNIRQKKHHIPMLLEHFVRKHKLTRKDAAIILRETPEALYKVTK